MSEINPYEVGEALSGAQERRPDEIPMFSSGQVILTALLGGPLGPSWLMMSNFTQMGFPDKARKTMWIGILGTLVLLAISMMLPENMPGMIPTLAIVFGYAQWFNKTQAETFQRSGVRKSWWLTVGLSILSMIIVLGVAIAMLFVLAAVFPDFIEW